MANATSALERTLLAFSSGKPKPRPPSWENEGNADAVEDGGCTCWDAIAQRTGGGEKAEGKEKRGRRMDGVGVKG